MLYLHKSEKPTPFKGGSMSQAYQKKKERRSNYNPEERTAEYYLKLGFTLEKAILFASWK